MYITLYISQKKKNQKFLISIKVYKINEMKLLHKSQSLVLS